MDAAVAFARMATSLRFEDLPAEAVAGAKKDILDTLGAALAGSACPGAKELVDLIVELGGKAESSIIAYGAKVPSPQAALLNSFMARSPDYDDNYDNAAIHSGASVVPAAFAAAQSRGSVSGREVITAVAAGVDMMIRMSLARQEERWAYWSGAPLYGYFGCALASSCIFSLSEEQTINALGIAYGQTAGNLQSVVEGTLTKNLDVGAAAHGGLFASLAARKGITGARRSLEGEMGLFNAYHRGCYDPKPLTDELGTRFEVANLSFRPYPCCRRNHTFIDLALVLAKEHNIMPGDVEEVVGYVGHEPHLQFHPVAQKQNPKSVTEAQFSIPYSVAVALIKGAVVLDDFTEQTIKDPQVLALAKKVFPKVDSSLYRMKEIPPAVLDIKTKDGNVYSRRIEHPLGHPENPLSMDAMVGKFRDCARHAKKPVPEKRSSQIVDLLLNLEDLGDVEPLMALLSQR